jgi:riboflavin-specific deaminase-like protein
VDLWRIYPGGETLTTASVMRGLGLADLAPPDRPYVVVNFVASADGKASFEGRSGKLGGEADSDLFHRLRTQVDAVLVGSGTLRAERYGRLVRDSKLRQGREDEGRDADPLACVISRTLNLPVDIPLFQEPEQRTVVFTSSDKELEGFGPGVLTERLRAEEMTLTSILRRLRTQYSVRSLLCEGGPTLFGSMLGEDVVDELFLSLAPRLAGGAEAPTIVEGMPLAELQELELVWVMESEGELFLRYRIVKT